MICPSACPFEALSAEGESAEVKLDNEECEVCGICSIAFFSSSIETIHYNADPLLDYVVRLVHEKGSENLVLTCPSSDPSQKAIMNELEKLQVEDSVSAMLPCLGEVPPEFMLKALGMDIKKQVMTPSKDRYCWFEDGSTIGARACKLLPVRAENHLGFRPDALTVVERSMKAQIERSAGFGRFTSREISR
jgi:ferredoxin